MIASVLLSSTAALAQCCPEKPSAEKRQALWQKLQADLRHVDQNLDGVMGLAVKDLSSGEEFFLHGDEIMPQASSIKIAVLANLYVQAQRGKLKLTDEYLVRKEDLVAGSDIMMGLTPGVTRLTLRDLARYSPTKPCELASTLWPSAASKEPPSELLIRGSTASAAFSARRA